MAKKIQLQDANGNVLHPLTLGECVAMDNGENLDTLMSKSQMFTPTIAQDKSMFKVGTGVDVDYSVNVKDGAYESLVFKGKSLVNISNTTQEIELLGRVDTHAQIKIAHKDLLKRNTKYILILSYDATFDTNSPNKTLYLDDGHGYTYIKGLTKRNIATDSGKGVFVSVITTKDEEKTNNSNIHITLFRGSDGNRVIISNLMLIEYQDGIENWDIPYFTGLCDSKMPILRNTGKNLFDMSMVETNSRTRSQWNTVISENSIRSTRWGDTTNGEFGAFIRIDNVKPSTTYTLTYEPYINNVYSNVHAYIYNNSTIWGESLTAGGNGTIKFTTKSNTEYITIGLNYGICSLNTVYEARNIQLEESSSKTSYEDHKSNILHTSEEIVLRSLPNGVCDTYNARTGEYVKRIGERTLNGSEAWIANSGTDKQFEDVWVFHNQESLCNGTVRLCDKLQARENANENAEFIRGGGAYIFVYISKNKVQNHNANDFKTWLQSNPLTVQYELAEPVTTIVKPSTMTPFAYQNGHVILESGFEGQSLLPEIEYSVVTGRTGQVTQNTKVLRQQEQQIIGLEELLLTQVVQMEYERTLLQFDYELQMMMLG